MDNDDLLNEPAPPRSFQKLNACVLVTDSVPKRTHCFWKRTKRSGCHDLPTIHDQRRVARSTRKVPPPEKKSQNKMPVFFHPQGASGGKTAVVRRVAITNFWTEGATIPSKIHGADLQGRQSSTSKAHAQMFILSLAERRAVRSNSFVGSCRHAQPEHDPFSSEDQDY